MASLRRAEETGINRSERERGTMTMRETILLIEYYKEPGRETAEADSEAATE